MTLRPAARARSTARRQAVAGPGRDRCVPVTSTALAEAMKPASTSAASSAMSAQSSRKKIRGNCSRSRTPSTTRPVSRRGSVPRWLTSTPSPASASRTKRPICSSPTRAGIAEAARIGEAVVVDLRLRMMMRRIARPAPRHGDDLAQHQLDLLRRVPPVEDGAHEAQAGAADLALAARLVGGVGGGKPAGGEALRIGGLVDGQLAVALGLDGDRLAGPDMQAAPALVAQRSARPARLASCPR